MNIKKRDFLKKSLFWGAGSAFYFPAISKSVLQCGSINTANYEPKDKYWKMIRDDYVLSDNYINLENGYYCIAPQYILNNYIKHITKVNQQGAFYMRRSQLTDQKSISDELAIAAGCDPGTLIITRNATESLNLVIAGIEWKKGDEAVMANQDYGAMLDMFGQVGERYGTVNVRVEVPIDPISDDDIINIYSNAITSKTRLLMVSHVINMTGQILPVKKICDMAHERGVQVLVDGAHAFGHIDFNISDLNCDYYGTSLHKWLSAPLSVGFLHVRRDRIPHIYPIFAESVKSPYDILRLNHTGTIPVYNILAIHDAISYLNSIGIRRKEARLRYLKEYWTSRTRKLKKIIYNTPTAQSRSCAIANVGFKDIKPSDLAAKLFEMYGIYTVAIDGNGVSGCRITPNIYTSEFELDKLVIALTEISQTI